ncbi:MAG: hypothetical protein HQ553_13265 [Chloroflexi bacterium]|nr:hypothetical protein [Chloroflexota bacterium]
MNNLQYQNPTSKKPILKIVVAVLVLLLIFEITYGSWKILDKLAPVTGEPATKPIAHLEPNVTADWKVYRNEAYDFAMKYPKDWEVACGNSRPGECVDAFFHSPNYKTILAGAVKRGQYIILGATVSFEVTKVDSRMNWLEWAQRARGVPGEVISSDPVNLNDTIAWKMVLISKHLQPPRKYISITFPNPDQQKVYEFMFSIVADDENEQDYRNTFNRMLSTFEFTE